MYLDGSTKPIHYIMKLLPDVPMYKEYIQIYNVFEVETKMYLEIVKEFEEMYKAAGVDVCFGAKLFKLNVDVPYLLLEDLGQRGFKNAKRTECLDIKHTKSVLKKLAQWHAVSAARVANKAPYPDSFKIGNMVPALKPFMQQMHDMLAPIMTDIFKTYKGHEDWLPQLVGLA